MNEKFIYIDDEITEDMEDVVGLETIDYVKAKRLGLNIPKYFIISTKVYEKYINDKENTQNIQNEIFENIAELENKTGKKFGDIKNPLLLSVSVSSNKNKYKHATIENIGLNETIIANQENLRWAWESYRIFMQDFVRKINELKYEEFTNIFKDNLPKTDYLLENEEVKRLRFESNKKISIRLKEFYKEKTGNEIPKEAKEQLIKSIEIIYNLILDTQKQNDKEKFAIKVEEMKFGNINEKSGYVSISTRDKETAKPTVTGYYHEGQQRFDSIFNTAFFEKIKKVNEMNSNIYFKILNYSALLEKEYKYAQRVEYIIENEEIFIKSRTNDLIKDSLVLKMYNDLEKENIITKQEVLEALKERNLMDFVEHKLEFKDKRLKKRIAKCEKKKLGSYAGSIAFSMASAQKLFETQNMKSILVFDDNANSIAEEIKNPKDIKKYCGGIILVDSNYKFSLLNIVAKMDEICIVELSKNTLLLKEEETLMINGKSYHSGELLAIDSDKGCIYKGATARIIPIEGLETIWKWNQEFNILTFPTEISKLFENKKMDETFGMLDPIDENKKTSFIAKIMGLFKK